MSTFLKRAANVVMVLSLIPLGFWLYWFVTYQLYSQFQMPNTYVMNPFKIESLFIAVLPWAVLWIIGYLMDGRIPWQIVRKGD